MKRLLAFILFPIVIIGEILGWNDYKDVLNDYDDNNLI